MAQKKIYFGWYVAGIGTLSLLFAYGVRAAFAVFFPHILKDLQMSRALVSGAVSLSLFVNLLLTPIAGIAVDKYGPKLLIVGGAIFCGVSLICMPLVTKLWHLYLIYGITFAIGVNFMGLTVNNSMCVNWFVRLRATAIAITTSGGAIGAAIFNPLSQRLIAAYGWRMCFAFIGVALLVVVIPMALIFARHRPEEMGLATDGDEPDAAAKTMAFMQAFIKSEVTFTMAECAKTSPFWLINAGYGLVAIAGGFLIHVVAYCMEVGIEASDAALALGYMALVGVGMRFVWGPINDYFKNRKISCGAGLLCYALGYTGLMFVTAPLHFYLVVTIMGIGAGGIALMPALVGDQYGRMSMGKIYGFVNVFGAAGGAIGPILAGWIYDVYQSYQIAWQIAVALNVIGAICWLSVGKSPYEARKAAKAQEAAAAKA